MKIMFPIAVSGLLIFTTGSVLGEAAEGAKKEASTGGDEAQLLAKAKANAAFIGGPVRVQSALRVHVPLADATTPSEQLKAMETARNGLYDISGRECATLQETFGVTCRLTGIAIDSGVDNRNTGSRDIQLSLTSSYELRPKP